MLKLLVIILLLLLPLGSLVCPWTVPARAHSHELEAILRSHIRVTCGDYPTFVRRAGFDAAQLHRECMLADLDGQGPVRAVIDGVPVYWANGYAEVDEPYCLLLVTAEPSREATAIATGEGAAAWAWGGAGADVYARTGSAHGHTTGTGPRTKMRPESQEKTPAAPAAD